ncbi:uncharacterized protein CG45076-like isoform X7 [Diorhabda sublineata]|uniref:uncharacterized protein CG45076-like isoform X7 n=1 Tax=Diorhabda sublineata TaxID=1163346 RepID=UPI0024E08C6F|nr:uncharacterized protein CG45076-like isoform X7 [Diorhabda sublineata]
MVYESDFYTTRRPYRTTPTISSYTISGVPSRQVRVLPGLGKVHVTYTYDRIVPYVGHKRLTVVTAPPKVWATRPSVLQREYDRIESKLRPWNGYSATNRYLNSNSAVKMIFLRDPISNIREYRIYPTQSYLRHKIYKPLSLYCDYYEPIRSLFWDTSYWPLYKTVGSLEAQCNKGTGDRLQKIFDDETRLIRAQTASLLKRIHDPVPRVRSSWPLTVTRYNYDDGLPARLSNDNYIHRLLITSPSSKTEYTTYFTEPVKKYIGAGHLASVSYAGDRVYSRRPHLYLYEDPLKSDIQLLSYYINRFKQEKAITGSGESTKAPLNPARATRKFTAKRLEDNEETSKEMQKLREARAARLAFINEEEKRERSSVAVDDAVKAKKKKEEERLAEEKALAEEQARRDAQNKKEEAARRAELARQEELAAQAAAERAAELERQAELAKQEELAKQAEIEKARLAEEERIRQEEQRRLEEEAKAEEERKQLERLEELARQAEEEKQAELARQAEELAELARQEAELAEQAKREAELAELARQEEELAELARQQAELEELERKEKELAELAEKAREEAEAAQREADEAVKEELNATTTAEEAENAEEELAQQEAELAELERQQAELDALEAEAQALESDQPDPEPEPELKPDYTEEEDEEEAKRQREMDELIQQKFELAELERQQAELDALDAEARALAGDASEAGDDEEEPAIAEDTPVQSDVEDDN